MLVKCFVWDLDNTLWNGILAESGDVALKPNVKGTLQYLDQRGILSSIASKNHHESAWQKLQEFELDKFFLYPQISWSAKSASIEKIAKKLNIGIDTIVLLDDDPFERAEVQNSHSLLRSLEYDSLEALIETFDLENIVVTDESSQRRFMYEADILRTKEEENFAGPSEAFLETLNLVLRIDKAGSEHLARAEELVLRTNQLNSTGRIYSKEQLHEFSLADTHLLLTASLSDRFGNYGTIALALIECSCNSWTLELLLISCRVLSRGIGSILLNYLLNKALLEGKEFRAVFKNTGKNRIMYITYRLNGFIEQSHQDGYQILQYTGEKKVLPAYYNIQGCFEGNQL